MKLEEQLNHSMSLRSLPSDSAASKRISQLRVKAATEEKQADDEEKLYHKAGREVAIERRAKELLEVRLSKVLAQADSLRLNISRINEENKQLRGALQYGADAKAAQELRQSKMLLDVQKQLEKKRDEVAAAKAKLYRLQADKEEEDARVAAMPRQINLLRMQQAEAAKPEKLLEQENMRLKKMLADEMEHKRKLQESFVVKRAAENMRIQQQQEGVKRLDQLIFQVEMEKSAADGVRKAQALLASRQKEQSILQKHGADDSQADQRLTQERDKYAKLIREELSAETRDLIAQTRSELVSDEPEESEAAAPSAPTETSQRNVGAEPLALDEPLAVGEPVEFN